MQQRPTGQGMRPGTRHTVFILGGLILGYLLSLVFNALIPGERFDVIFNLLFTIIGGSIGTALYRRKPKAATPDVIMTDAPSTFSPKRPGGDPASTQTTIGDRGGRHDRPGSGGH